MYGRSSACCVGTVGVDIRIRRRASRTRNRRDPLRPARHPQLDLQGPCGKFSNPRDTLGQARIPSLALRVATAGRDVAGGAPTNSRFQREPHIPGDCVSEPRPLAEGLRRKRARLRIALPPPAPTTGLRRLRCKRPPCSGLLPWGYIGLDPVADLAGSGSCSGHGVGPVCIGAAQRDSELADDLHTSLYSEPGEPAPHGYGLGSRSCCRPGWPRSRRALVRAAAQSSGHPRLSNPSLRDCRLLLAARYRTLAGGHFGRGERATPNGNSQTALASVSRRKQSRP